MRALRVAVLAAGACSGAAASRSGRRPARRRLGASARAGRALQHHALRDMGDDVAGEAVIVGAVAEGDLGGDGAGEIFVGDGAAAVRRPGRAALRRCRSDDPETRMSISASTVSGAHLGARAGKVNRRGRCGSRADRRSSPGRRRGAPVPPRSARAGAAGGPSTVDRRRDVVRRGRRAAVDQLGDQGKADLAAAGQLDIDLGEQLRVEQRAMLDALRAVDAEARAERVEAVLGAREWRAGRGRACRSSASVQTSGRPHAPSS